MRRVTLSCLHGAHGRCGRFVAWAADVQCGPSEADNPAWAQTRAICSPAPVGGLLFGLGGNDICLAGER